MRKSIETRAYPEQVWDALTEVELLGHWMSDSATGWPAVGGTLTMSWERFGLTLDYKVAEVSVCRKLVLKTPMGNGNQTVTFALRRSGQSTWVDLTDAPPPFTPPNPHSSVDSTWTLALAILKLYVERYFRRSRHSFMAVARAGFTFAEVLAAYTTPEGLSEWMADEILTWPEGPNPIGQPYCLRLLNGQMMSGYVMAISAHEACLSWDEIEGFLELKSFSLGPGNQMLCLRGSGYGLSAQRAEQIENELKPFLLNLADYLDA